MSIPQENIIMVGPRGVGKTSLIAAMYNAMEAELRQYGCQFYPQPGPTQAAINGQLKELKKAANGLGIKIQEGEGIDASSEKREYSFLLDVGDGGDPEVILNFIDLPGGWFVGQGDFQQADKLLSKSSTSFLAVDATALMENPRQEPKRKDASGSGKCDFHEELNAPDDMKDVYKRVTFDKSHDRSHAVLLVLIRAEKYIQDGRVDEMISKTREKYKDLADVLKRKNIHFHGCYVETAGGLVFNSFGFDENGGIQSRFRRVQKIGYNPSRCSLPFRIALIRAMESAFHFTHAEFENKNTLWGNIKELFGGKSLPKARERFAEVSKVHDKIGENIKEEDYFAIEP